MKHKVSKKVNLAVGAALACLLMGVLAFLSSNAISTAAAQSNTPLESLNDCGNANGGWF